jgi:hypothetical protein
LRLETELRIGPADGADKEVVAVGIVENLTQVGHGIAKALPGHCFLGSG